MTADTPGGSPALVLVRKKGGVRTFYAYMATHPLAQEPVWYRPRWWGGETWYWKEEIERV